MKDISTRLRLLERFRRANNQQSAYITTANDSNKRLVDFGVIASAVLNGNPDEIETVEFLTDKPSMIMQIAKDIIEGSSNDD